VILKTLPCAFGVAGRSSRRSPGKTRRNFRYRGPLTMLMLLGATSLSRQQNEADKAWTEGRYETARIGYERVLQQDPNAARANLRLGILLSWKGKLDSSLVLIGRARIADPHDSEMRLAHARVHSWNKQYDVALALYDSMLTEQPGHRDAELARSQTLSWAGRLEEADPHIEY